MPFVSQPNLGQGNVVLRNEHKEVTRGSKRGMSKLIVNVGQNSKSIVPQLCDIPQQAKKLTIQINISHNALPEQEPLKEGAVINNMLAQLKMEVTRWTKMPC